MNFKEWIKFTSWTNDGTIVLYIDDKRYVFDVDPIYHAELKRIAKYKPFTALNKIKELIKYNKAQQIA